MTGKKESEVGASYQELRALKSELGPALMKRHGAHSVGIARPTGDPGGEPRLTLYIEPGTETNEPVPPTIEHRPAGHARTIRAKTQVVERSRTSRR